MGLAVVEGEHLSPVSLGKKPAFDKPGMATSKGLEPAAIMTGLAPDSARSCFKEWRIVNAQSQAALKMLIKVAASCSGIGYAQKSLLTRDAHVALDTAQRRREYAAG